LEAIKLERYKSRNVDELGRISIPSELRKELSLDTGDKISLTAVSTIVVLQKAANDAGAVCDINDIGMITLPAELRQQMGWKEKDKVALYHTDSLMILKSDARK